VCFVGVCVWGCLWDEIPGLLVFVPMSVPPLLRGMLAGRVYVKWPYLQEAEVCRLAGVGFSPRGVCVRISDSAIMAARYGCD
jgi:hypothetical protein